MKGIHQSYWAWRRVPLLCRLEKQINTSNCSRRGLSGDKTAVSWVQGAWTDTDRRFLFVRPRPYSCGEDF